MARIIDESKLGRIKLATIELVVSNGYGGASTSAIARKAEVAEGYLYRFYSGKQELVTALLFEKVGQIITQIESLLIDCKSIRELIEPLFEAYFTMAETSPVDIQFIHVLMHDYNFQVSDLQREQIKSLCKAVIDIGQVNHEIRRGITEEEIFTMAIIYPIEFINLRMKGFFGKNGWTNEDKQRIIEFSLKAIK